jgi:hypothetical protein
MSNSILESHFKATPDTNYCVWNSQNR